MPDSLEKEFEWYLANQTKLVKQYDGKFVVIKGGKVIDSFDDEIEAIEKTSKGHDLGTFLVQQCTEGEEGHTQVFHSRVAL